MDYSFEESLVSVVRSGGVSIAFPSSLSKADLACVLHGLAGALFREAAGSGEHGALPQRPQKAYRTKRDRRGLPRKKVVERKNGGRLEVLECGHEIAVPTNWKRHESRSCEQCAPVHGAI